MATDKSTPLPNISHPIFKSELTNGKDLRWFGSPTEPLFVAKDIAEMLGYKNTTKAMIDHIDEEDKITFEQLNSRVERIVIPLNFQPHTVLINESGLYSMILRSKLVKAKKFKRWVTSEVLPSIRKTGQYNIEQKLEQKYLEVTSKINEDLKNARNKLLSYQKKHSYHKFKKGSCLYIISDSESCLCTDGCVRKNKYKIGIEGTNINRRLQEHRTSIPTLRIDYLIYTEDSLYIETSVLKKFKDRLTPFQNHEWFYGVKFENMIEFIESFCDMMNIEHTRDENVELYNSDIDRIINFLKDKFLTENTDMKYEKDGKEKTEVVESDTDDILVEEVPIKIGRKTSVCECGVKIGNKAKNCVTCHKIKSRKVQRPSYMELKLELSKSNYVQVGKKYGVSDNAIRKWLKIYENNNNYNLKT
jgi:prophage antirepressor-like protein